MFNISVCLQRMLGSINKVRVSGAGEEGLVSPPPAAFTCRVLVTLGWRPAEWAHTHTRSQHLFPLQQSGFSFGNRARSEEQIVSPAPPELIGKLTGLPAPPCGGFSGHVYLGCDPEHAGIINPIWPGDDLGPPGGAEGHDWSGRRTSDFTACPLEVHFVPSYLTVLHWWLKSSLINNMLILSKIKWNLKNKTQPGVWRHFPTPWRRLHLPILRSEVEF